jgi:hypothetical protein
MVILDGASAHSDGVDEYALLIDDGHAPRKGDQTVIGMLNAVKRLVGLR